MFWLIACLTPYPIVPGTADCVQYADADDDGFGDPTRCLPPDSTIGVANGDDCNDQDAFTYPGAQEICDGFDQDCDRVPDNDAVDAQQLWADADNDGFGDPNRSERICPMEGWVGNDEDCDDGDSGIYPNAPELCDDADRNCDGDPYDNPDDGQLFYLDQDGDGFGRKQDFTQELCFAPDGYVESPDDCDDSNADVNPSQTAFFTSPTGAGGFDYDCSGYEEPEYPDPAECDASGNLIVDGYVNGDPGCGDWGWFAEYCVGSTALGLVDYPTQACR